MFSALRSRNPAGSFRVGLSIAGGGVALAAVRWSKGGVPTLEHCLWRALPVDADVAEFTARLLKEFGLTRAPISAVVQHGDYQLVLVEAPDVLPSELRAAIRWRLKDAIDFHLDDAVVDVFELPAQARGNTARMMYAVAAHKGAVAAQVSTLHRFRGFDVVDIPELCLRNIASRLEDEDHGVALVQLGERSAQVIVARRGTLYLARHLDFQSVVGVSDSEASADAATVALELQRSLDYYERTYDQPPISDLVVAPAGRRAAVLSPRLAAEASLRSRILDFNGLLAPAMPVELADQDRCLLAVGAALRREQATL